MTRGQSEAIGIIIVVALIIVLFMLFSSAPERFESTEELNRLVLDRYLDALIASDIEYQHLFYSDTCRVPFSRALRQQLAGTPIICPDGSLDDLAINEWLDETIARTLEFWGVPYVFTINSSGTIHYERSDPGPCVDALGKSVVPINGGNTDISLEVCVS